MKYLIFIFLCFKVAFADVNTFELPKLLTEKFYKIEEVCKDAKIKNKPYLLLALKSHACDCIPNVQMCLNITRNLIDPCNHYIVKNFSLYHLRLVSYGRSEFCDVLKGVNTKQEGFNYSKYQIELTGAQKITKYWGDIMRKAGYKSHQGILILGTKECKVLSYIDPEIFVTKTSEAKARLKYMNSEIRQGIKDKSEILEDDSCSLKERKMQKYPSLEEVWKMMENQRLGSG